FVPFGLASNGHMAGPISVNEVERCLKQVANASAPGPDRIRKQDILAWDPECEELSHMFNVWWITGVIPKCFKQCRTVLIPKTSDQGALMEIGNWRPITIGSMVLRLFSRVLTKRLVDTCPLHPRQRGFRTSPGCSENLEVLRSLFEHCKEERSQFAVVFVDFARAFDSVSHEHFLCVLREMEVDPHVVELIRGSYQDCVTRVEIGDRLTPEINVKVGVKQGDPMSPLLFNLAMDPLIHGLERLGKGLSVSGTKVTTLAFADDLVLVSDSWQGMAHNLGILEAFCEKTGLRVKPSKSNGFLLSPTRDSFTVNNCPPWVLGGSPLNMVQAAETVGYLGVRVSPWKGIVKPTLSEDLLRWCENLNRALLKPSQKVVMLNKFAIPRLLYQADHCEVNSGTLQLLDRTIRERVRAWLHLPPSTCDGLLYARNRDGGLGICKLARLVPSIQARRIFRLSNSTDDVTRSLLDSDLVNSKFRGLWLRAGGKVENLPQLGNGEMSAERGENAGSSAPPGLTPFDWRRDEFLKWANLPTQGVGILSFHNSKASNSWLAKPKGFKERHYIAGLQLRANVYPTREFRLRGRGMVGASCRRCPHRLESCSHVLGQCPATHRSRLVRHNKLCRLLATEAEGLGWEVRQEWAFRTSSGELRRLDLVLIRDSSVLVIDVTVRFEYAPDSLTRAAAEKTGYYGPHKSTIARELHARDVRVYGFPLGARGLWHPGNEEVLTAMGVGQARRKTFAALLSRRALLYSLDVLRDFTRPATPGRGSYQRRSGRRRR
ncbi:MAG: RNA-directed DNA polymerase, partial [Aeromonas veronii]